MKSAKEERLVLSDIESARPGVSNSQPLGPFNVAPKEIN